MILLIQNIEVYTPEYIGVCDVVIGGDKIVAIDDSIDAIDHPMVEVMNGSGKCLAPGFVDSLVHISGGGGEGGFNSRTPDLSFHDAVRAGVTTLMGALGTDDVTRTLPELYGKAKSLTQDGLNCYIYTGSYSIPAKPLLNSIKEDIIFIDNILGVGEVAIADHRGSQPTTHELARLASEARVGGLLSGKSGVVLVHVGDGDEKLTRLHEVANTYEVCLSQFYPTHINRTLSLLQAGAEFAQLGGFIDLTASTNQQLIDMGELRASDGLKWLLDHDTPASQITFSSDAQGSLPHFNEDGKLDGLDVGSISSLHKELVRSVKELNIDLSIALSCITKNPAAVLGLTKKGELKPENDADLVIMDKATLAIESVMSRGQWLLKDKALVAKTAFDIS